MIKRRTKIVITIGPATDQPGMLEKLFQVGANVCRINFSHGTHEEQRDRVNKIRELSQKLQREVAILADLQGPKIRIAKFKNKKITLKEGEGFTLDAALDSESGDETQVGIDYKALPEDVSPEDILLLDDGRIVLIVEVIEGPKIICRVKVGGELSDHKGINRQGGGLSANALTDKDKGDLKFAAGLNIDYIAISFPKNAEDVKEARRLAQAAGSDADIIAKIERTEAVENVEEIAEAADGLMIARGDLGVEMGDENLPALQKRIIRIARDSNKPVITATQMMETMIHNVIPTRAEVFDVANAVLDMTDAVMLSAETAIGDYPDLVVKTMARICLGAERQPETKLSRHRAAWHFEQPEEAIAMAAMYVANHLDIKAIISLTETGHTPLLMSRIRTGIPIIGLTRNLSALRRMNLYRGVVPISFDIMKVPPTEKNVSKPVVDELKARGILFDDDLVLITRGDVLGEHGLTNRLKLYRVGERV